MADTPSQDLISPSLLPRPPHLLKFNHDARLAAFSLFTGPAVSNPGADLLGPNPYAHMSSPSPVHQFPRDHPSADVLSNWKITPTPRTARQPAAVASDGHQSSINSFNQLPKDISSAHVLSNLKTTPVPRTAKRTATATADGHQSRKRAKTRISLPLTLNANSGPATVMACPDTGSEENIISLDLAQALGYNIFTSPSQNKTFELADGRIVEAVGEIIAECSFGLETTPEAVPMTLVFYVFMKLASPIIMGLAFLEQTRTLSKHRDRLIRVPRPAHQPIQVYSVGRPRNQLYCYLNKSYVPATPDSGSEVNLMTQSFASRKGLHIEIAKEVVEFADGTVAVTSGVVRAKLAIRKNHNIEYRTIPTADFYLIDDLRHDLIVGEDSLEELRVFTRGQHALFPSPYTIGPAGLNRIRHLGAVDDVLSWVKKKISLIRRPYGASSQ
jgi:hypothetical protein